MPALNRAIRNKPRVSTTMQIAACGVTPSRDVGFIGVRNTQGQTVQKNIAALGQMENVIMAVMYEPSRV